MVVIVSGLIIFSGKTTNTEMDTLGDNIENIQNGNIVEINNGEKFIIELESNPTTGYSWVVEFDENNLEFVTKNFVQQKQNGDEPIVGAGGTEKFQFKSLKTGETKINFYYLREWEIDVAPADQKTFNIIIKMSK